MGRCITGKNDLYTWCINNGERGQQLLSEWIGEDTCCNNIDIKNISYGSKTKVTWKCDKGHIFEQRVNARTCKYSENCPICKGMNTSKRNSELHGNDLYTWCKSNGEWGQQLISEWVGISEDNKQTQMNEVARATKKKYLWKCSNGHEWYCSVAHRTMNKRGCPHCCTIGTSYQEQFIYECLKRIFSDTENRCKVLNNVEYDIGIPSITLCIEYSPTGWHKNKLDRDQMKIDLCHQYNVNIMYILEDSFKEYKESFDREIIIISLNYETKDIQKKQLIRIVEHILSMYYDKPYSIDYDEVEKIATERSKGKIEYSKSVAYLYPELCKEVKDRNIDTKNIRPGSHQRILWKCTKCQHEWENDFHNRVQYKSGCPNCHYNWYKAKELQ